ncbi:hypothetical protein BDW62DRAFT_214967 [Aspergillus aurantiobrunneus]
MVDSLMPSNLCSGSTLETGVMTLFNGPFHNYVTPKFYTETASALGKVAGTWNYAAVQVYGKARVYFNSKSDETNEYLTRQLYDLSDNSEKRIMGYTGKDGKEAPWNLDDVPQGYMNIFKKGIVGIEVSIDRIEGKFKMSQEKSKGDREGVERGFEGLRGGAGDYSAGLVRELGKEKDVATER